MTVQITGSWQLDLDRLVERVSEATAEKVLARLHAAAQEATAEQGDHQLVPPRGGEDIYDRIDPEEQ